MENLKEVQTELLDKVKSLVEEGNVNFKGEVKSLLEEIKSANEEQAKELDMRLSAMEVEAKKASKEGKSAKTKSFAEEVSEQIEAHKDAFGELVDGSRKGVKLTIKAPADVTSANITAGDIPQAQRLAGLNAVPTRSIRLMDLVSRGSTTSDKIEWVYQANKDGAAGSTAEGAAKNQIDFEWVVGSEDIKKKTAYIKVTDEMLAKGSIVAQEINNELMRELSLSIEDGVYDDNAVGANLRGLTTVASAFAAGSFAGAIGNANNVDVLAVAMNQIRVAQEGKSEPNAILMHPTDVTALKFEKLSATDKRYVGRVLDAGQNLMVDGVPVIPTTLVTETEFLIGDFSKAELWQREGMSIEIGYDSDDFTKNFKTIRAEWRGALVVRNNNRSAFVYGDFATAKASLETA